MYSKRVFALMSLVVVFAMLMTACGSGRGKLRKQEARNSRSQRGLPG